MQKGFQKQSPKMNDGNDGFSQKWNLVAILLTCFSWLESDEQQVSDFNVASDDDIEQIRRLKEREEITLILSCHQRNIFYQAIGEIS